MVTSLSWTKTNNLGGGEKFTQNPTAMEESTTPLFDRDSSEEEYLDPTDDMEMDNDESGASHAGDITPVPLSLSTLLPSEHRDSDHPLLPIRPLPRRAFDTQERRSDIGMDNNSTSHPDNITPAPQPNTAASAGTVVLFHRNPDSPLFKVGDKRPAQAGDEEHRKQKDQKHKSQTHVDVRAIQLCNNFVC
jgi:hypothetical protein